MKFLQGIYGCFTGLILIINTLLWGLPIMVLAAFKLSWNNDGWQRFWSRPIIGLCTCWAYVCLFFEKLLLPVKYDLQFEGLPLSKDESYLVLSNHQSMTDIVVLFKMLVGRVPFMRFFAKAALKKVPVFGIAWQAMGCPFMQRYSKEFLEQNPHLKGKDLEETISSCRKLRQLKVCITNYVEGTRFTEKKHHEQQSPYRHLLTPRAGGVALAIAAMEGQLKKVIDVTVYYHQSTYDLWDYLCARLKKITVIVNVMEIPEHFAEKEYQTDAEFKLEFQAWLNQIWQEKDEKLVRLHQK